MGEVSVLHGDSRELLKSLGDASIDSVVCDPPYALVSIGKRFGKAAAAPAKSDGPTGVYARASSGFMGKTWDVGETAFAVEFWAEVYRVLKPGAHVVAFSGTRTYHRLACAIEDAGFEIRDQLAWAYGSGFPKSHDVSKAIDKHLGHERKKVRHKPRAATSGTMAGSSDSRPWIEKAREQGFHEAASHEAASWSGWGTALKPAWEPIVLARKPLDGTVAANVLAHGCGALNIDACRIGLVGGTPKGRSENKSSTCSVGGFLNSKAGELNGKGRWPANVIHDGSAEILGAFPEAPGQMASVGPEHGPKTSVNVFGDYGPRVLVDPRGDEGSSARFFYSAKAGPYDRFASKHPTVKPVDLMRWLVRLVTPPGGVTLDPFAGSGTTGAATLIEGFDCILMEREDEYVDDIKRRLDWMRGDGPLTEQALAKPQDDDPGPLFAGAAA